MKAWIWGGLIGVITGIITALWINFSLWSNGLSSSIPIFLVIWPGLAGAFIGLAIQKIRERKKS